VRDEHFKFYKVCVENYSGKVRNVYMVLWQIYSGNYVLNEFCRRYYTKHFGLFFPDTVYVPNLREIGQSAAELLII